MPAQSRPSSGPRPRPPAPRRSSDSYSDSYSGSYADAYPDAYPDAYAGAGRRAAPSSARRGTPAREASRPALLPGRPAWVMTAVVLLGPIVAAIVGQAAGSYYGPGFAVLCVASALLAAAVTPPRGLWFLIPGMPAWIWVVAAGAELAWHNPPYEGRKAQAVGLVHATTHGFPVMATSMLAMGVLAVAGAVQERKTGARRG